MIPLVFCLLEQKEAIIGRMKVIEKKMSEISRCLVQPKTSEHPHSNWSYRDVWGLARIVFSVGRECNTSQVLKCSGCRAMSEIHYACMLQGVFRTLRSNRCTWSYETFCSIFRRKKRFQQSHIHPETLGQKFCTRRSLLHAKIGAHTNL